MKESGNIIKYELITNEIELSLNELIKNLNNAKELIINKLNPNMINYEKWDVLDIISWINSLENGRFIKYNKILKTNFINDEIKGIDLPNITRNHLKQFGINIFGDRIALETHFQSLMISS